jgi:Fe-S cluster assembly scaffold protein SufB
LEKQADRVQPICTVCQRFRGTFAALNGLVSDGAFVHLPKGCVIEEPIHLLFLSYGEKSESRVATSHPGVSRSQLQARILKAMPALGRVFLTNAVTELIAEENALLTTTSCSERACRLSTSALFRFS